MPSTSRTIIVGGGIVGLSSAYYLARRGHPVTVLDRADEAVNASGGNAGIIALGHVPLPRPGLVGQAIRMLLKRTNPLYIAPRLDLDLLRWLWQFRRACTQPHLLHCMDTLARLGHATGACFRELVEEEGIQADYHRTGWLEVFNSEPGFQHGRETAELIRGYGFETRLLSGDELRRREPAFQSSVVGAVHYTDSGFASPARFVAELAERVEAAEGEVLRGVEVERLLLDDGRFQAVALTDGRRLEGDTLVLAAGAWTTPLARSIGLNVPMQPGKGYHVNLSRPDPCPGTTAVLAETFVAVTPIDGGLRLAGTVELSGLNQRIVQRRLDMLRLGARQYINGIDDLDVRSTWCGLRPCTADGLPIVGWAPGLSGVFVATGHAMMGFALGPITGRLVSEAILDGETSIDLAPLAVDRFRQPARV